MIFLKHLLLIAPGTSQPYKQAYYKANHMKLLAQNHLAVLLFLPLFLSFMPTDYERSKNILKAVSFSNTLAIYSAYSVLTTIRLENVLGICTFSPDLPY